MQCLYLRPIVCPARFCNVLSYLCFDGFTLPSHIKMLLNPPYPFSCYHSLFTSRAYATMAERALAITTAQHWVELCFSPDAIRAYAVGELLNAVIPRPDQSIIIPHINNFISNLTATQNENDFYDLSPPPDSILDSYCPCLWRPRLTYWVLRTVFH